MAMLYVLSPWMFFQNPDAVAKKLRQHYPHLAEKQQNGDEQHKILCRHCKKTVTHQQHKIEISGRHRHFFTNPNQMNFELGCFAQAQGCVTSGQPTLEYTWFHNYFWNYAFCQNCHAHLGWHYRNGQHDFYGLILNTLLEE